MTDDRTSVWVGVGGGVVVRFGSAPSSTLGSVRGDGTHARTHGCMDGCDWLL